MPFHGWASCLCWQRAPCLLVCRSARSTFTGSRCRCWRQRRREIDHFLKVGSEGLLHKKAVFRLEGETRTKQAIKPEGKKRNESECREPGKDNVVDQRAVWVDVSKSAEGGTPSHRHGIRWQAGGRMEHAMVTPSPTMPLQCVIREPGMECSKHTCASASA